jgi:protoheme IX farnesyltransferase
MTLQTQAVAAVAPPASPHPVAKSRARQSLLSAHMQLGKVRLNAMVVFTTALGYFVGAKQVESIAYRDPLSIDWHFWSTLFWTCLGTFLAAVGASAFNQAIEARRDARMHRTRNRPLCTGRLSRTYAATFGLIVSICGVAILCPLTNGLTASLAAFNILLYAILYTPLKPLSTINTLVGAVVGGIPPMIGWAAATGSITPGAVVLGAILFVWQIPHFLALCWIYREDYARGGFKMLPIVDPSGTLTSRMALIYALMLMPLCLLVGYLGNAGPLFIAAAFILTAAFIMFALRFAATRKIPDARKLFFASIIYLPLLCITLMFDARGPYSSFEKTPLGLFKGSPEGYVDPGSPEGRALSAELQDTTQPAAKP